MAPHLDDTIVAISSAPGGAMRAIVRLSGPQAHAIARTVFTDTDPAPVRRQHLSPGTVKLNGVHSPLPADLYLFHAPRTYTGQDLVELHTLGSPPLIDQLLTDLLNAGARPAQAGEFTLRAFLSGKKDLTQAEAVLAVIDAGTDADLQHALSQLAGGVTQPLQTLRDDLLNLLADVEAALDFTEEDIEFVTQRDTILRLAHGMAHLVNLKRQMEARTLVERTGRVVLVGEPNAGKSRLFNALLGTPAAIVSDSPGTTRDYLTHPLDLGSTTVELIDTAGWQVAQNLIEEQAQQLGQERTTTADVVLWCVPCTEPATTPPLAKQPSATWQRVRTKADLLGEQQDFLPSDVVVSALDAASVQQLRMQLRDIVLSLVRPPLAPSQARCKHHIDSALAQLREAHKLAINNDPPELLAFALRRALDDIGAMAGTIYTNDLLDRIFSRFCIGK